ncbi:hypothetical protein MRX96_015756 [Rhipicephalus microplus]
MSMLWLTVLLLAQLAQALELSYENNTHGKFPDLMKIRLISSAGRPIVMSWRRQNETIDFYKLIIHQLHPVSSAQHEDHVVGSCAILSIRNQFTIYDCPTVPVCTEVVLIVGAYRFREQEMVFPVTAMMGLFAPGREPDSPANITTTQITALTTKIKWDPPAKLYGTPRGYTVKVCDTYSVCDEGNSVKRCVELVVFRTALEVKSIPHRSLCVLITANSVCGNQTHRSLPATVEIPAPLFGLT